MPHPVRINHFFDFDIIKKFGGEWFSSFLKNHLHSLSVTHDYLKIDFYKDGKSFDFDLNRLKDLSSPDQLPCSLRLTNVQLIEPQVLRMCKLLEKKYGKLFTCNLYYTPGPERNCFDFHVDQQLTFVCQISGSKDWIFPLENQECLIYLKETNFHSDMVREHEFKHELLVPGQCLEVPFGMVHKVEIQGTSPSLHFTFGSFEHTQDMVIQNLISLALKESGLDENIKQNLNREELVNIVSEFQKAIQQIGPESFAKEYMGKLMTDEFRVAKMGRPYKKDPSSNQD